MSDTKSYFLRRRYELNDFANRCGYFFGRTNVNNGYGCLHPLNEEGGQEHNGAETVAPCYTFSCPLAYESEPIGETDHVVTWRRTPGLTFFVPKGDF